MKIFGKILLGIVGENMTGKELSNILKKRNISIAQFSKMINVNELALKKYLKEDIQLRNDILVSTSRALQLSLDDLFESKVISRRGEEIQVEDLENISMYLN